MQLAFFCPKDVDKERVMQSKSNKTKFTLYNDANEVVDDFFETLHSRYQGNLEKPVGTGDFAFNSSIQSYCKCHKVVLDVVAHILILQAG